MHYRYPSASLVMVHAIACRIALFPAPFSPPLPYTQSLQEDNTGCFSSKRPTPIFCFIVNACVKTDVGSNRKTYLGLPSCYTDVAQSPCYSQRERRDFEVWKSQHNNITYLTVTITRSRVFPRAQYSGAAAHYLNWLRTILGRKAQPSVVIIQRYYVNTVGNHRMSKNCLYFLYSCKFHFAVRSEISFSVYHAI